ncbi:MAG: hypothetical protein POELPBGB_02213 [Bacteroidia bacterium]|nr:hypothetical protein [Bacteroidia bacterium]
MKAIKIKMEVNPVEIEKNRIAIEKFSNAMGAMELTDIAILLDEKGDYDGKNKTEFLNWLGEKFNECLNDNIFYLHSKLRYCKNCRPGNATLLFNHGSFPKETNGYNGEKGFMLEIENGIIIDIGMCYGWLDEKELYYCVANN